MWQEIMPGVYQGLPDAKHPDPAPASTESAGDWWETAPVELDVAEQPW